MALVNIMKQKYCIRNRVIYTYITRCVPLRMNSLFKSLIVAAYSSINDAHAM